MEYLLHLLDLFLDSYHGQTFCLLHSSRQITLFTASLARILHFSAKGNISPASLPHGESQCATALKTVVSKPKISSSQRKAFIAVCCSFNVKFLSSYDKSAGTATSNKLSL